jgi:subtilase family serine protease
MKHLRFFLLAAASVVLLAACGTGVPSTSIPERQTSSSAMRACPESPGHAQCEVLTIKTGVAPNVAGWGPSDLQAAYNLPSASKGKGQIIAVVDAYDNPNVASDLAEYRSYFGLPPANFTKYNQEGYQGNYPKGNIGWGLEIDLDVQMVSASCPNCTIYLIEANSFDHDLLIAEKEAVKLGAHIVTNSWACAPCWGNINSAFNKPGVVYLACAYDNRYGSYGPAKLDNVVSVGGTVLAKKDSKYKEVVWPMTGGGCANGITKPSWQHDPGCTFRTQNDVAAVAWDVAEYDSYGYGGWITVGGTSIATPLIAGIYGLAGNASAQDAGKKFWTLTTQQRKKYLNVIREGSDGDCGGSYLCTAGTGQYGTYSGPTGWGTPNGIGAF